MAYSYLASPYSDPDPFVREARYLAAAKCVSILLSAGKWVYSPIVHCHELAKIAALPGEFEFWRTYNMEMLERAHALKVLTIPGWEESKGVQAEITVARNLSIPVFHI